MYEDIYGIILCAGASQRMGEPKWKALIEGKSFLQLIIAAFNNAGIEHILAVFRKPLPDIQTCIPLLNPNPERGQLSSLKTALYELPPGHPFMMQLVDRPLVKSRTFKTMISEYDGNIVIPAFKGRKGHPVIFPPQMRQILLDCDDSCGIRAGIQAWKGEIKILEVNDEAVLWNIDTKEDLKAARQSGKT